MNSELPGLIEAIRRTLRDAPCDACKEAHSTYESHRAYRAKLRALGVV